MSMAMETPMRMYTVSMAQTELTHGTVINIDPNTWSVRSMMKFRLNFANKNPPKRNPKT